MTHHSSRPGIRRSPGPGSIPGVTGRYPRPAGPPVRVDTITAEEFRESMRELNPRANKEWDRTIARVLMLRWPLTVFPKNRGGHRHKQYTRLRLRASVRREPTH